MMIHPRRYDSRNVTQDDYILECNEYYILCKDALKNE